MKYKLIVYLFLLLPAFTQAITFSGIVKLKNGQPVTSATVFIEELNSVSTTGEDGRFEFEEVTPGRYKVVIFSLEINKKTFEVEVKDNSSPFMLEVEPSMIRLDEVLVSGNSKKKEIETKGFAVNVIEVQKLATQSVQTNELLDRAAGVRVRQDGGLGSKVSYNINGLSGSAIKVFIDGVPASNYGSSFSLNSIPPLLIERVEVYKGVVPGYLSEDALGGAINVILKKRRKNSLTTSYSVGSFNTHQWNATGSYRWENGLTVDGSVFYNYSDNNYKVWGDDIYFVNEKGTIKESNGKKVKRFHDAYESFGGKFNVGWTDVKWADLLLVGGVFSKEYKEKQHGVTMLAVYGDRHTRRKSGVLTLNYSKEDFLLKNLSLKVDASHSYLSKQVIDTVGIMHDWNGPVKDSNGMNMEYVSGAEVGKAKTLAIDRDYTNVLRANLNYKIHDNHWLYANYLLNDFQRKKSDKLQPAALQKLKNTHDLQKNILSFTYENLAFSQKLRTNVFYKHYFQKLTSNEPFLENGEYEKKIYRKKMDFSGYGITLSFRLLPNLYLLGSAEKTYRLPNENEVFGSNADNLLPPSPELEPEKSYNANLGVNYALMIGEHSFGINTSIYFRDTKGMIREAIVDGSHESSKYENLSDVLTKGIDAELTYSYADRLHFKFNVSKFDVLFNTEYDKNNHKYLYYRTQIRNEPSFKFNANLSYSFNNLFMKKDKASIYYNVNYVEGFLRNWANVGSSNLSNIPTQYPMDLALTYSFLQDKIVLGFDAKNIFNQQVYDNYGLQKPGRAFYAKVTYFIF